jgi:hypothetical protein
MNGRALNRALLARQGLLEPLELELRDAVEAIGALQAQHWPAVAEALATRVRGFQPAQLYRALDAGELVTGTLIRRTLHLVSAREHPDYAAVAAASGVEDWWRASTTPPDVTALRRDLRAFADRPRTGDELAAFLEAHHGQLLDEAELAAQRAYNWRAFYTTSTLVRVPADGVWSARSPSAYQAAPDGAAPDESAAFDAAVRCHLRAFGPAAADDIATWSGGAVTPVRRALDRLDLEILTTDAGRTLHDLPGAPRPDPDVPAPVRLLPAFDSVLLAYAHKHRQRILPDEHRDAVYARANLRIRPTLLVDGFVAGLWAIDAKRRTARLTVTPFGRLDKPTRAAVAAEAERLVRVLHPTAPAVDVVVQ